MSAAPDWPATTIVRSRVPDVVIPDMSVTDYIFRNAPDDAVYQAFGMTELSPMSHTTICDSVTSTSDPRQLVLQRVY